MRMTELILKKRHQERLSDDEIQFVVEGYTKGTIPDYQMSAFLMTVVMNGMDEKETAALTLSMMKSGEVVDLSAIQGIKVDKHSTGGVGDKTSLVLGPMVAACGAKVAKMSGRGLGHTGGTLDKLESIPGFQIQLEEKAFQKQVQDIGLAIIGQSSNLVPADKKMYALRDVTGTVDSVPLIASSIMSKKLATGSDAICLDVKFGSGAFFHTLEDARLLAQAMVNIGVHTGRDTRALLTDMDQPLGFAIGNILEVKEAVATLQGNGPKDLLELCLQAGCIMLMQAKIVDSQAAGRAMLLSKLQDGSAFRALVKMIEAQGGDVSYLTHPERFPVAKYSFSVVSSSKGSIQSMDALALGECAMRLGAGRAKKEDPIDYTAGIILHKKIGDSVQIGEALATLYTNYDYGEREIPLVNKAFLVGVKPSLPRPIVHEIIQNENGGGH